MALRPTRTVLSLRGVTLAERQLVEIAKVLTLRRPRILIFDEPTAALGHADVERLFRIIEALRDDGVGIIFVSHRYQEVLRICDRATVLRNGRVVGEVGRGETSVDHLVELTLGQKVAAAFHREWRAESAGDVRALSRSGAMGLMQIMPDTWAELRARYRFGSDPYEPRDNILAGAAYLREMHDRYGSPGFLAAYNAGPGRYAEYLASGRALPAETRAYVAALVPVLGGAAAPETSVWRADPPPDWREAAIFVVRSADARPAGSRSDNARSDDSRSSVTARPSDPAATSDSPLVVARSSPGERP